MRMNALLIAIALTGDSWFCCVWAGAQEGSDDKSNVIMTVRPYGREWSDH